MLLIQGYRLPRLSVRYWLAPLMLAAARARRRPARWLLPALGIALAAAFAAGVAAQAQVAGDQSARAVLDNAPPADSEVRVIWPGPVSPGVADQAKALIGGLGLGSPTEVVLMNPVRLSGVVVRPAAIAPLGRWLSGVAPGQLGPGQLGPCRPSRCPMLLVGGGAVPSTLAAAGVNIQVTGLAQLRSPVPLGFVPSSAGAGPVLVTWDVAGLEALPGLSGLYRTHSWLAQLTIAQLRWWELTEVEDRLARSQARLLLSGSQFSLSAPFGTLEEARTQASVAPQRLLLAGGGAIAALALFIVLAGGGLRRDQRAELDRLRQAGARTRPVRPVRRGGVRVAVRRGTERRRGRGSRRGRAAGQQRRRTGGCDPDAQRDHPGGGDHAVRGVAGDDRAARHAGAAGGHQADRRAGRRGGVGPGGGAGRGHRHR